MPNVARTLVIAAALAGATALTACQDVSAPSGGAPAAPAPGSTPSSGPATTAAPTTGDVGADGSDAGRRERLTVNGGYVLQGSRITFVYRTGMRYTVDLGQQIADRDGTVRAARGTLTLSNGTAVFSRFGVSNDVATVNAQGAGSVTNKSGTILVTPDGSTSCLNSKGIQVVGASGERLAASKAGAFYTDSSGKRVTLGQAPNVTNLAGRFTVCNVGGTASMDLYSDVLFAFNSDALTPAGKAVVANAASTIRADVQGKTVNVVGHTDSKGTTVYNHGLGRRRANAVATQLRSRIPGVKLVTRSAGETEPVAANTLWDGKDYPQGRAKNRRTTISWAR